LLHGFPQANEKKDEEEEDEALEAEPA